ncbi:MAG: hypothetical protein PHH91_11675 [Desulfuromonadaceae bacterium]|nr:hypothetical protein [Desulfuromonadaceae bacterium]
MTLAALSPNSILAAPIQVNPQVKSDQQASAPQVDQDAQKAIKTAQTDTVTISPQALKMADDKNAAAEEAANKRDEQLALQLAKDKAAAVKNETQKNAVKAYASAIYT